MHPLTVLVGIGLLLIWMGKKFVIGLVVILVIGVIAACLIPTEQKQRSAKVKGRQRRAPAMPSKPSMRITVASELRSSSVQPSETGERSEHPASGLIVRSEPLQRILSGVKTWEMRSIATSKRELIALIPKGGREIVGVARIVDVRGRLSDETMTQTVAFHGIEPERLHLPDVVKLRYAWVLADVKRFKRPVPYTPRSGAVRFVTLNAEEREQVRLRLHGEA